MVATFQMTSVFIHKAVGWNDVGRLVTRVGNDVRVTSFEDGHGGDAVVFTTSSAEIDVAWRE